MTSMVHLPGNDLISTFRRDRMDRLLKSLILTPEKVEKIQEVFRQQMTLANSPDENERKKSDHLMMNTFIRELLDGSEQGDYLGLDLGGTNFRVVLVQFKDGVADTKTTYYSLTEEVLCGPASGVFNFIAESLKDFLEQNELMASKTKLPLGFTFSFPSEQLALNKSILLTWTKTFRCPDGVGSDPVQMLEEAIKRKAPELPIDVVVVMSDTVSTLMAGNYLDKNCRIGLILGTGCNAAFVENIEDIAKWTGDYDEPKHVIVNVELGSTGDNGCLDFVRSRFEKEVDQYSNHPRSFTFEKSFSGMYLGELIRLVLAELVFNGGLFNGGGRRLFTDRWSLTTSDITQIESDVDEKSPLTREVLASLDITHATEEDIAMVKEVCAFMSRRGAHIIAIAMSVLVNHIKLPEVTIGIDGSLYEKHPRFHNSMMEIFEKLCPNTKVKLILAKDGSGQGAAFAAVSALKQIAKQNIS